VTVTSKETVTVTAGQTEPTGNTELPGSGYPTQPEADTPAGDNATPVQPSTTPSPLYPINNGTNPFPVGSTGFVTSTKPSIPVGTGIPTSPDSSSTPDYSLVSEVPTKPTPTPAGHESGSGYGEAPAVPSASSTVPSDVTKPAPTPAGHESGSGYG
ncbi:hypothetical protein BDU57DRAFT_408657, partial [Ampelomyces quisqualis]